MKVQEEVEDALRESLKDRPLVEPTEEEKKNGWTAKTLSDYLAERQAGQSLLIDVNSLTRIVKPTKQNHRYNPLRWRT